MKLTKKEIYEKLKTARSILEWELENIDATLEKLETGEPVTFDLLDDLTAPLEYDLREIGDINNELIKEQEQNY